MIIEDLFTSVMRFCDDFRISQAPGYSLKVVNFDAHADDTSLPEQDVIGISSFTSETEVFTDVMVLIGISTLDDPGLTRHMKLISRLYEKLLPEARHKVYYTSTGQSRGMMVVTGGTRLMPISSSNARPLQFIAVSFTTDCFRTP